MFMDRTDAGRQLSEKLLEYEKKNPLVVALPRGGVLVGSSIADALHAPLELITVHNHGVSQELQLLGRILEEGISFLDVEMSDPINVSRTELRTEYSGKESVYRESLPLLTSKTVILVDDGFTEAMVVHAAFLALKKHHPKKIVFATPVFSKRTKVALGSLGQTNIYLQLPEKLEAVSMYYHNFYYPTDEEVIALLKKQQELEDLHVREIEFGSNIVW